MIISLICGIGLISSFYQLSHKDLASYEKPFSHVTIDTDAPSNMHIKTTGDLNGDRLPDLVAAGISGEIVWYEYPHWKKHVICDDGGGWSTDAETGDIDNDGDQDLVISDWYQNNQLVWFENRNWKTDHWLMHIIGSPRAHDIELIDLNRDERLDIVSRQQGEDGNSIEVWLHGSEMSWINRTIECPKGEGLAIDDLNRNGLPDIVIANKWFETPEDALNGVWMEYNYTNEWRHDATVVKTGDLNQDGLVDIVLTPSEPKGTYYKIAWFEAPRNPLKEHWTEHIIINKTETVIHSLGIADMNNDGKSDIVIAEMHQGNDPDELAVYYSNNSGTNWIKKVISDSGSHNICLVDIGGDGDCDIFGANWSNSNKVDLWENLTNPQTGLTDIMSLDQWTYIQVDDNREERYFGLAMNDLTGDGFGDIVSGKYFYRNPGLNMTGHWTRIEFPLDVDALLSVNVDGDSYGDVIALDKSGMMYWLEAENNLGSAWTYIHVGDVGQTDHNISSQGYTLGQIVPGGKPIILINVGTIYYFSIPDNPEDGLWTRKIITRNVYPEGIGVNDIDGDGDNDICGTLDNKKIVWWENPNSGSGNWPMHEIGSVPDKYADRIYAKDLNGDHLPDIIVSTANGTKNGLYWWEQSRKPNIPKWKLHNVVIQGTTNSMDVADMDGDGDFDIVSGEHRGNEKVAIWENNGRGSFYEKVISSGKESHLGTRVADLDSDGDLDIVSIAWDEYKYLHLWRNDALNRDTSCQEFTLFDTIIIHSGDKRLFSDWDFLLRMKQEPGVPENWLNPFDFANGILHVKLEIITMNETSEPVGFGIGWVNLQRALDSTIQHRVGWPICFSTPGIYEGTMPIQSMWHGPGSGTETLPWDWTRAIDNKSVFTILQPHGHNPFPVKFHVIATIRENRISRQ